MKSVPRVFGKVAEIMKPPSLRGKFLYGIFLSFSDDNHKMHKIYESGSFDQENLAYEEMVRVVRHMTTAIRAECGADVTIQHNKGGDKDIN